MNTEEHRKQKETKIITEYFGQVQSYLPYSTELLFNYQQKKEDHGMTCYRSIELCMSMGTT